MVAKICSHCFCATTHTGKHHAAVSAIKFRQSTGNVLKSTGEENCMEDLLVPNGAPLLRISTAVSWHYLYNNGLLGLVRYFIKKCLIMFLFLMQLIWGFKKNKRPLGATSTEFLGKIREIQY